MPKINEFTVSIVQPLTASRSGILLKFLAERTAKREGFTVEDNGAALERIPGETGFVRLAEPADRKPVPKGRPKRKKGPAANFEI